MCLVTHYVVQQFEMKRGRLAPGSRDLSKTEAGAIKKAEAISARVKGCAAMRVVADDETGDVSSAAILSSHGAVPDDLLDLVLAA